MKSRIRDKDHYSSCEEISSPELNKMDRFFSQPKNAAITSIEKPGKPSSDDSSSIVTFSSLSHTIKHLEVKRVRFILELEPQLVFARNHKDETPLQIAIKANNTRAAEFILKFAYQLDDAQYQDFLLAVNKRNENILHYLATYGSYKSFKLIAFALGNHIYNLARTVSIDGFIPLNLFEEDKNKKHYEMYLQKERDKLTEAFLDITIDKMPGNIQDVLIFSNLIKNLTPTEQQNIALINLINQACIAINHARSFISYSSSHPSSNFYSRKDLEIYDNRIKQNRDKLNQYYQSQLASRSVNNNNNNNVDITLFTNEFKLKFLQHMVTSCKSSRLGNCAEYSWLVLLTALEIGVPYAQNFHIVRNSAHEAGHEFTIFTDQPINNFNDIFTPQITAVVVDAWAGKVYPASNYLNHLDTLVEVYLKSAGKSFSIAVPFDRHYHSIEPVEHLQFDALFWQDRKHFKYYSGFSTRELAQIVAHDDVIRSLEIPDDHSSAKDGFSYAELKTAIGIYKHNRSLFFKSSKDTVKVIEQLKQADNDQHRLLIAKQFVYDHPQKNLSLALKEIWRRK